MATPLLLQLTASQQELLDNAPLVIVKLRGEYVCYSLPDYQRILDIRSRLPVLRSRLATWKEWLDMSNRKELAVAPSVEATIQTNSEIHLKHSSEAPKREAGDPHHIQLVTSASPKLPLYKEPIPKRRLQIMSSVSPTSSPQTL